MTSRFRRIWSVATLVVVALVGLGIGIVLYRVFDGDGAEADIDRKEACLELARSFTNYPILYAGEEVVGQPLQGCVYSKTEAQADEQGRVYHLATDAFFFAYGTCDASPDHGCASPVNIVTQPACTTGASGPAGKTELVRGASGVVSAAGNLWLPLDGISVSVLAFGNEGAEREANSLAIAGALVPANDLASPLQGGASLSTALGSSSACP